MNHRLRIFGKLALAIGLFSPVASAQKPAPGPPPSPSPSPSPNPGRPSMSPTSSADPTQPISEDLVMFLRGRVATQDGSPLSADVLIERFCNNRVRQEVHASTQGDFSMQLGSRTDSFPETSDDPSVRLRTTNRDSSMGIPRRELTNCELRASASGFQPGTIPLLDLDPSARSVDVGVIVVRRAGNPQGRSLSAIPYKAPKDARKAYEKGLAAEKNNKLESARQFFAKAIELYPKNPNAWFQLGAVLQKQNQKDSARKAFTQATTIDAKFLPPYLSLASMAYQEENWRDVLDFTGHILDLDPLNRVSGYILDLDPINYADAYFYNAFANYRLNKLDEAERMGLKAERMDMLPHFPQLHLILAELFARKSNYAIAIAELQTYLDLVPHAPNAQEARDRLAELEKLTTSTPEKQN